MKYQSCTTCLLAVFFIISCSSNVDKLIGKWTFNAIIEESKIEITLVFKRDGTAIFENEDGSKTVNKYKLIDGNLMVIQNEGRSDSLKIGLLTEDSLRFRHDGITYIKVKKP